MEMAKDTTTTDASADCKRKRKTEEPRNWISSLEPGSVGVYSNSHLQVVHKSLVNNVMMEVASVLLTSRVLVPSVQCFQGVDHANLAVDMSRYIAGLYPVASRHSVAEQAYST